MNKNLWVGIHPDPQIIKLLGNIKFCHLALRYCTVNNNYPTVMKCKQIVQLKILKICTQLKWKHEIHTADSNVPNSNSYDIFRTQTGVKLPKLLSEPFDRDTLSGTSLKSLLKLQHITIRKYRILQCLHTWRDIYKMRRYKQ